MYYNTTDLNEEYRYFIIGARTINDNKLYFRKYTHKKNVSLIDFTFKPRNGKTSTFFDNVLASNDYKLEYLYAFSSFDSAQVFLKIICKERIEGKIPVSGYRVTMDTSLKSIKDDFNNLNDHDKSLDEILNSLVCFEKDMVEFDKSEYVKIVEDVKMSKMLNVIEDDSTDTIEASENEMQMIEEINLFSNALYKKYGKYIDVRTSTSGKILLAITKK